MSNKIVPGVYRSIINDVITHISADFEEYGMEAELLERLQAKWEENLRATKVADFPSPQGENGQAPAEPPAPTFSGLNGASAAQPSTTDVHVKNEPDDALRLRGGASDDTLPPSQTEPKPEPNAAGLLPGDEVIDSELDDSDDDLLNDEDGEGEDGEMDIVFCVYDKVARVKNKWKTIFKDGVIHINGRDYLFAKCQGEFEW